MSYPSFFIYYLDTRQRDVHPDLLFVLTLGTGGCCHSLKRMNAKVLMRLLSDGALTCSL